MKRFPLIANKISFKEFKDKSYLLKVGRNSGFIFYYDWKQYDLGDGYTYRILISGGKSLYALRAAYFLLFGNTDSYEQSDVTIAHVKGMKVPIGGRVNLFGAYRSECFDTEWFNACMAGEAN